jgi:hypothetical protein
MTTRRKLDLDNPEDLVLAFHQQQLRVNEETERLEELKGRIRDLGYINKDLGDLRVIVRVNKTWDKKRALATYGDLICSLQVDQKLAEQKLTGEEYNALYNINEAKPVVVVTPIVDKD